jgi:tRNA G18 (ribose-2'-O)-methylase SpoU
LATPIRITDADDSRLEPYRSIRERDLVGRLGRFILEGDVVLRQHLRGGRFPLESLLLSERRLEASADLLPMIPGDVPIYVAGDPIIEAIAGFSVHRGILGIGLKNTDAEMDGLVAGLPERACVVAAIGMANHDNMGGLFRNAAAFGCQAVLLDHTCCDPLYRKAIRVSVGATLTIPFARSGTAGDILQVLASHGFAAFGLSPSGALSLSEVLSPARVALVLGAEGSGLPRDLMARMTTLRIPMVSDFDSLNVATASGIALSHFFNR